MSVDNKPHQAEPVINQEDDGFGGSVSRFTDAWYNYFANVTQNINTTIIQKLTSVTYTQSNSNMMDGAAIDQLKRKNKKTDGLIAQSIALAMSPNADDTERYFNKRGMVFIGCLGDLPPSIAGVITLRDEFTYYVTNDVDLVGSRLLCGANTVIIGSSSENCRISSTGLTIGTALITSVKSLALRHLTLESATIFDLDASGSSAQALDWYGLNLDVSTDIGTIANYSNFVCSSMAWLGVEGLILDGEFDTIAISESLLHGLGTGSIISLASTCIVNRRFRIAYSSVVVPSGGSGINVDVAATISTEGYMLDTCNFSGTGTLLTGVPYTDNKARFTENRGIQNSFSISGYYMQGNATSTAITVTSTPVKVAGTTAPISHVQRFDNATSNKSEYVGEIPHGFLVTVTGSVTSGNNKEIGLTIGINGTPQAESLSVATTSAGGRVESVTAQLVVALLDTNYIEIFAQNNTGTDDITVENMNVVIVPIG